KPYIKNINTLNYLLTNTRLNITFTVSKLYKGNTKPINRYIIVIKYFYRYLTKYSNLGIILGSRLLLTNDL
ncbi:hypothetical protein QBC45DRAFT_316030, partial [Copromyces sp. CBS 386.78]